MLECFETVSDKPLAVFLCLGILQLDKSNDIDDDFRTLEIIAQIQKLV